MRILTLLIAFLLLFIYSSLKSDDFLTKVEVKVGKQPTFIYLDENSGFFNIICLGYDADFDGIYDANDGDEPPSWWRLKNLPDVPKEQMKAEKLRDFDWGFIGFPFRPAISNGIICFSQNGFIKSFDLKTGNLINDKLLESSATALSIDGQILYIASENQSSGGVIIVFNLNDNKTIDTLQVEKNVRYIMPFTNNNTKYLAILSEGNFGLDDSKLQLFTIDNNTYSLVNTITVGMSGNHLAMSKKYLAVAVNGSHVIKLFDINDFNNNYTIKTPTTGYQGPRESLFIDNDNYLLVSAYSGILYMYDIHVISNPILYKEININAKFDGLAFQGSLEINPTTMLLIANTSQLENYDPADWVTVFATFPLLKEEKQYNKTTNIYPNPINNYFTIELNDINNYKYEISVEIFSSLGREIIKFPFNPLTYEKSKLRISADEIGLQSGTYFLKVNYSNHYKLVPFIVIK